jgi:hypothetical protein
MKLTDLLYEKRAHIKYTDGSTESRDIHDSVSDEKAKSMYAPGKVIDGREVEDVVVGPSLSQPVKEVIQAFGDTTQRKLSAKSAESLRDMLGGKSWMQASQESMQLLQQVMQAEAPYRDQLEELAKEVVYNVFPIVKEAGIDIDAKLVQSPSEMKISKGQDEEEIDNEEEAEEALDVIADKSGIDKRRIINSITQGAALRGSRAYYLFDYALETLDTLGVKDDYEELMKNAYGIYDDDQAIAMMMAMLGQSGGQGSSQGGESEVDWNEEEDTMTVKATALTFPILLMEIIKGLYEFVSLQGFSADAEKNKQLVKTVDKVQNEPEDIRWGKFIYDALRDVVDDYAEDPQAVRELVFAEIYKLEQPFFQEFIEAAINDDLSTDHKRWVEDTVKQIESGGEDA